MYKHFKASALILTLLLSAGIQSVQAHEGKTISGIIFPESVIQAKDGHVFVSEIVEFGKDGDGKISVIDQAGKVSVFSSGLDDPKGLAIIGKDLYVADNKRVLKITPDGKSHVFAAAEAFPVDPKFLNDLEADAKGNLYVSDSGDLKGVGGAIYRISPAGKVTTVIDAAKDQRVLAPNGLLIDNKGTELKFVDFVSGVLYGLNLKTGVVTKVAEGFGGGDGLVKSAEGTYYVSDWNNGKVFSVKNGEVKLLKDGFKASADIALTRDGRYLLVPDMKAGEVVYLPLHEH